jgi:hypothetical protein
LIRGSTAFAASRATFIAVAVVLPLRGLHETPRILTVLKFAALVVEVVNEPTAPAASDVAMNFLRFIFVPPNLFFFLS